MGERALDGVYTKYWEVNNTVYIVWNTWYPIIMISGEIQITEYIR